ncbi:MAG: hypothetical protein ACOVS5_17140 [Oligoflexus sp.]
MVHRGLLRRLRHAFLRMVWRPRLGDVFAKPGGSYRRRFHRHSLAPHGAAWVLLPDQKCRVLNLSYGGLQIAWPEQTPLQKTAGTSTIQLQIMGFQYPLRVNMLSSERGVAGFAFARLSPMDEQFLSSFLYYMDAGITLKSLAKHSVDPSYKGPGWLSYGGGQGAIEVHLHLDIQGRVDEAHVFYLNGLRQDFALFSSQGILVACTPKRELSTPDKRDILIHVVCILIGLRQIGKTDRLDALIEAAILRLQRAQRLDAAS